MTRRFLKPMFVSLLIAGSALACPPESEGTAKAVMWTTAAIDSPTSVASAAPIGWTTVNAVTPAALTWYSHTAQLQDGDGKDAKQKQSVITAKEITVVLRNGEHTIEFTQSGDEKSARVDGKTVPSKRIVEKDKQIIIMGENGEPLCTLHCPGNGITFFSGDATVNRLTGLKALGEVTLTTDRLLDANNNMFTYTTNVEAPKAMIGITMGEIEDVTAAQLGVSPAEVVLVTDVAPKLAAAKAGLRKYDVIVKVDGEKPVTEEKIRHIVRTREPGEKIDMIVLRESQPMEFNVELLEYKPGAWGNVEGQFLFSDDRNQLINVMPKLQGDRLELLLEPQVQGLMQRQELSSEALKTLQSRALDLTDAYGKLSRLNDAQDFHVIKLHELLDRELHNAKVDEKVILKVKEVLGEAAKNLDIKANVMRGDMPLSVQIVPKAGGQQVLVMPEVTEQALRQVAPSRYQIRDNSVPTDRLQRLEDRMARLEALLEKLIEMQEASGGR